MPLWLIEDPTTLYILLGLAALGLTAAFFFTSLVKYLIAAGGVLLLALLVMLVDYLVVSDHERIEDRLLYVADRAKANDFDELFKYVSSDFQYGGMNKDAFRGHVQAHLHRYQIDDIVLWDFKPQGGKGNVVEMLFSAKVRGEWGDAYVHVLAQMVKEEGDWRLKGFRLEDPGRHQEIQLP